MAQATRRRKRNATSTDGTPAGTALANVETQTARPLKRQITIAAASDMVKSLAAQRYREARERERARISKVEASVGGQCKRVDQSVVDQARQLMTRLALISKARSDNHSGYDRYSSGSSNAQLDKIVGKMGVFVGELEAFQLTNRAVGLFETLNKEQYEPRVYDYSSRGQEQNPLAFAGSKVRAEAKELLDKYEIVTQPKTVKKGRGKNATFEEVPGEPVDLEALNDEVADEDDVEIVGECEKCNCTDDNGCEGGCTWANPEHTLCSRCANTTGGDE